jgi:hypothetical protein
MSVRRKGNGLQTHIDEGGGLNTDGERADVCEAALELDAVGHSRQREDTRARGKEMTRIVVCVEADEVTVEDSEQNFTPHGENAAAVHIS